MESLWSFQWQDTEWMGVKTQAEGPVIGPQLEQPGIAVTRHDDHNVEIKIIRELAGPQHQEDFDLYLFIPRSFDIPFWGKQELQRDFRIRMRVSLPQSPNNNGTEVESARQALVQILSMYEELKNRNVQVESIDSLVFDTARDVGAIFVEWIKKSASQHSRELMMTAGLNTNEPQKVLHLLGVRKGLQKIVNLLGLLRGNEAYEIGLQRGSLALFEEYLSQAFVQYLGTIRLALQELRADQGDLLHPALVEALVEFERDLDLAQSVEAGYRAGLSLPDDRRLTDQEREERLLRLSLIKKFFQARTFVSVGRQPVMKRFSETTALLATSVAGICAALLQRWNGSLLSGVTFSGLILFTFGVFVYVLRDRMKDWAREKFNHKIQSLLPDFEQDLEIKNIKVGRVQEWFNIIKKSDLSNEVLSLRRQAFSSSFEDQLQEEVLAYRRNQEFEALGTKNREAPKAMHEVIRLNIERYLKYMDDPMKEILSIDNYGKLFKSQSRRVYHFHLVLRSRVYVEPKKTSLWRRILRREVEGKCLYQDLVYRLVLNKTGLLRLEKVNY